MSNTIRSSYPMGGAMLAAPRQIWLATLGAAAVTRGWAEKEAGAVFRTLVKEGSAIESHAIRFVGNRIETSVRRAHALLRDAREGADASVAALARAASKVRSKLPAVRARIDVDTAAPKRARGVKTAKPAQRAAKTRGASAQTGRARTKK